MTITSRIHEQFFTPVVREDGAATDGIAPRLIRMPLTHPRNSKNSDPTKCRRRRRRATTNSTRQGLAWSAEEHERFLRGLELFPRGPWKDVASYVGTRTVRQTMTHAQKYRQKIERHKRGLQTVAVNKAKAAASTVAALPSLGADALATSLANLVPLAAAPSFEPIRSPSTVEELVLDLNSSPAEIDAWLGFDTTAPPLKLQLIEAVAETFVEDAVQPATPAFADELSFLLDDPELDAMVSDDLMDDCAINCQRFEPLQMDDRAVLE